MDVRSFRSQTVEAVFVHDRNQLAIAGRSPVPALSGGRESQADNVDAAVARITRSGRCHGYRRCA